MDLVLDNFRGGCLETVIDRLEDYDLSLVEVNPPRKSSGTGEKRVLDIRQKNSSSSNELIILYSFTEYN
ncbi:hypothetical protein I0Q91_06305 [Halanaerobiaceae bacterium Z-7014]|uniref:Uncharacterized protein n=1 Tax=Halonatronomonas betaini TaxID=2778430 RepID=A0A931F9N9_9FIRM|nr:hypothetical protein [Halonatronomonas betaini]MBF8436679.1 hypothetical protein [Halonatronomonas betaini]